jgi:hypothetical protein
MGKMPDVAFFSLSATLSEPWSTMPKQHKNVLYKKTLNLLYVF